jgi:DNA adenine methylase
MIKGRFVLSYNDHPDIWQLYEGFQFRQVKGKYSISREADGRRSFGQLIITNF